MRASSRDFRVTAEEESVEIRIVQQFGSRTIERQPTHLEHERAIRILQRGSNFLLDHHHLRAVVCYLAQQRHDILYELR